MAMTVTKTFDAVVGSMRMTGGTYADDGGGTGTIRTGLQKVAFIHCTPTASDAEQVGCSTTLPSADPITVLPTASSSGYWMAVGW
jgi:hypothetical protein